MSRSKQGDEARCAGRVEVVEKGRMSLVMRMWGSVQEGMMSDLLAELENSAELRLSLRRTLVRAEQDRWNRESED